MDTDIIPACGLCTVYARLKWRRPNVWTAMFLEYPHDERVVRDHVVAEFLSIGYAVLNNKIE